MTADKKAAVAAKIKALLAKTTENGCTEAEALAAMSKARKLMDEFHIDEGTVGMAAEGTVKVHIPCGSYKRGLGIRWRIAGGIADYTDTKVWTENGKRGDLVFFGLPSDVDFAVWLVQSLDQFVQNAVSSYHAFDWEEERSFIMGCCNRLAHRMHDEADARKASQQAEHGSKALVVVKGALVEQAFKDDGTKLKAAHVRTRARDAEAAWAGRRAADKASFGRPVNQGGSPVLKLK